MKKGKRRIAAVIICVVAVLAIVAGSLAWYTSTNSLSVAGNLLGFKTYASVNFEDQNGKMHTAQADENGLYTMSLNPSDLNYVGNLRVLVIHKGHAKSYVRVKMSVQWTMPDGTVTQNTVLPYSFSDNWYDNRSNDYYVYCTQDSELFNSYDKSIITGFDSKKFETSTLTETATPKIAITAESVQINRYKQIWGIDSLPWSETAKG